MKCAQAGALASGTRMEFEQGTNYSNVLPNDALSDVLGRAMRKAGGYEYTPEEQKFAGAAAEDAGRSRADARPARRCRRTTSEGTGAASTDVGRRELGGADRAVHGRDVRARRGRPYLAGRRVRGN